MVMVKLSCTSEVMLLCNWSRWKRLPREAPSLLLFRSAWIMLSELLFDCSSWIPSVLLLDLKSPQEFSLRLMPFRENSAVRAALC